MKGLTEILKQMRSGSEIRFNDLVKVCTHYFGQPRQRGSHMFFPTPWQGMPLVNLQDEGGKAKRYQVKQVLRAIDKLEAPNAKK